MNSAMAEAYPAYPASPDRPLPPVTRPHAVSEVTPAKKITFFKSGDPQFNGVKMAINRRSFKSFSALMDDLSNRVPLPFGVRTITTPRGTHNINRLDQLQDGGSYICSDKKYAQPITGRKVGAHKGSRPVSARKQGQQNEPEEEFSATHFQQVPKLRKKVVLVKNGDPTVRRSIILNRRNARNFKTFLEDASDLLQFTVRRLYTVDGRRIENIQGVLQSLSVLICAGREPFKPIQTENVRKSITEKLPGLRSHHSYNHNSEIRDNKKNANFGLKAKKSVIHPRSASSNKTRFSLSSEKSDPNGLNMSPANSGFASDCPHGKSDDTGHSLVNDDIEKKVHVNKDGSLSVEMKVRFRLLNEETLQWSTQIKKSSTTGKTKCEQVCLYDENGKSEMNHDTFSETDESFYPCDGDSYSSKLNDAELDMYCAHCGMQCQEYDIWKNPMHANPQEDYSKRATWQTQSSASSTRSHHKLVSNQKASIDSLHTMSSEEYTEHVVHKSSCYSQTKENGETTIRYSRVSQCTSRSSQSTAASNVDASSDTARQKTGDSQNKSRSSHRSRMSFQNQESQHSEEHLKIEGGGSEDCNEPSPTPCSDGERCSQRAEMVSQSLHSRTSQRRLLKRDSTNTKSFGSNISYNENEERDETSAKATLMNMLSVSTERGVSENHSECTNEPEDEENVGHSAPDALLKSSASDCDKCSSRASSHSRSSAGRREKNKSCSQNGDRGSRLSSISKQNGETLLNHQESLENCETMVNGNRSTSSKSNRKSLAQSRGQSFQSNRSHQTMSPVADSALPQEQVDNQITIQENSCNESLKSYCTGISEECTDGDGQESLPVSRSSSKSQSFGSKYNNVSCPENEKNYSVSSRVSSASEKKGKLVGSSEICDRSSSRESARAMSQNSKGDKKLNDLNENAETCSRISAVETPCIHSPSPPKDKPVKRHLRSSHYKYSSNSLNNDPLRNINGEVVDSSRSSTPASKGLLVSKISIETCKLLKNSVSNNNSTEDIYKSKKRKNSSSSSKRKLKVDSLDQENHVSSELTPSALPNVSPEEVVNEWLKKIPSETMAVEYEVEECQKKVETEGPKLDIDKEDNGELNEVSTTEEQNVDQVDTQMTEVCCTDNANQTAVANLSNKEEIDTSDLSNNSKTNKAKEEAGTEDCASDKRSLPNNIHNSVQIMKALLNPLQESKLDRSNSLPEVSQTMGRKLSNSAQVLISCLAGLQLLNDGPTNPTKNSNDSKCIELLNIFQALWAEGPTNKNITDIKCGKHYSREDELTPVSSSGVDINSGFDGSGDGSITGGGDGTATEKSVVKEVECDNKNIQNADEEPTSSGDHDTGSGQTATTETADAGFDETKSYVMDENMNEKKIESNSDGDVKDSMKEHGCTDTEAVEDHVMSNNDTMNILSHNENETTTQKSNSQEASDGNSSSQTTIISTSDSNGKNNPATNDQTFEADPVWVLKLLKKIEKEFMTHYVDAMHEFKVRWNLENNDNLEEMIAELKNEVSQRIQRSISNELKKIKTGIRMPRPPDDGPKRKSSLQAEERRRRLQAMQRRSMHGYAGGNNMEGETNDSCETDEEDLTFSASFADDSSGQANDEFCPCEKCIKQKKLAKLAKPRPPVAEAPIVRAFDLQQILKIKRENNEPKNTGEEACENDVEAATGKDCPEDQNEEDAIDAASLSSKADDEMIKTKSDIEEQDSESNETDGQQDKLAVEDEICEANDLQCEPTQEGEMENEDSNVENKSENEDSNVENESKNEDSNVEDESKNEDSNVEDESKNEDSNVENESKNEDSNVENESKNEDSNVENESKNEDSNVENKSTDDLDNESENAISDDLNSAGANGKEMSTDCPADEDNAAVCEDEQPNQLDDVHQDQELPSECEEKKETSDSGDVPIGDETAVADECPQNGACHEENDTTNPVIKTEENSEDEDTEAVESHGLYFQRSCLGNGSLITQNGSVEDLEECKETNNTLGETSPNGQSNSSGSKHSQMYPDSSSEEEDGDSPRASPAGKNKSESIGRVSNNKESFDDCDGKSKKALDDDIIDQDDLDF